MNKLEPPPEPPPAITPIKVEKKKTTGTRELTTMARALDAIHDFMIEFSETVRRTEKKEGEIAARLCELTEAITENGDCSDPEIKDILEDLDKRIFEETFYTEKSGGNVIRMTDDTKFGHLRANASEAAKVSSAKFKMSADDYVPKITVIIRMNQSIDIFRRVLKEKLGPQVGESVIEETMEEIIEVWDEQE